MSAPPATLELAEVEPGSWRAAGEGLLDGDIVWFPVRHHSPACARHVRGLVERVQPYAVLVEGPRSFDDLIPLLVHPEAVYPLAIYAHCTVARDDAEPARLGSYYPLCDYSPELAALRAGAATGARLGFVDADHQLLCTLEDPASSGALNHERHLGFSVALDAAARRAGCRDHNDLWDHLFETTDRSPGDFVSSVNGYGLLARSTTPRSRLESDGTLLREAVMAEEILRVVADRARDRSVAPIVVVTGAFHTCAIRELVSAPGGAEPPAGFEPQVLDEGRHLIRYSFDQLDALNGYGSGMPSPGWYQRLHELAAGAADDERQEMLLDVLGDIAARLRGHGRGDATSTPSMIAALQQAQGLGAIRGRVRPGRTDLVDAVTSCFVQGDVDVEGLAVEAATRAVLTGERIGKVPPGTDRPPIAADFERRCRELRLPVETSAPVRVELDVYRNPAHRDKSRLLHGLAYLGVTYGSWAAGPRFGSGTGRSLIREIWVCQLSPATDVGLVEASKYGPTVSGAVAERYVATTAELEQTEASAHHVAQHLARAAELGVHDAVPRVVVFLQRRATSDPDLASVAAALTELQLLWSARASLDGRRIAALPQLVAALYQRGCYLIDQLSGLAEAHVDGATEALLRLRDALAGAEGADLDPALFWDAVERLDGRRLAPALAGVALGLLWSERRIGDDDVVRAGRGRLLGTEAGHDAAGFLRGLMLSAREATWQVDGLIAVLDELIGIWDDGEFRRRLPGLRSAFATLTPRETDRVAELVGGGAVPVVTDLDEGVMLANLERDTTIADLLREDGLAWAARP